jgi:hypothetical protein
LRLARSHVPDALCLVDIGSGAPQEEATAPLPVLVFFHGGRYEQGSEGVELYDGQVMANASNVIVVTANYRSGVCARQPGPARLLRLDLAPGPGLRLGVLGFLTLPSGFTGNYGIRDQVGQGPSLPRFGLCCGVLAGPVPLPHSRLCLRLARCACALPAVPASAVRLDVQCVLHSGFPSNGCKTTLRRLAATRGG